MKACTSLDEDQPYRGDVAVLDLPVLEVTAGDDVQVPSDSPCGGEYVDPSALHRRADEVHVPAESPDTLVDDPFVLLGDAVQVLAVNYPPLARGASCFILLPIGSESTGSSARSAPASANCLILIAAFRSRS